MDHTIARYIVADRQRQLWEEAANERLATEARKRAPAPSAARRTVETRRPSVIRAFVPLPQHHS